MRSKKIDDFLAARLSDKYLDFWMKFTEDLPRQVWERPSSSSGKYHKGGNGTVHTIEEHTLEVMKFVDKLARIYGNTKEEQNYECLLLAAALHDSMKYGEMGRNPHTVRDHGQLAATRILKQGRDLGLNHPESLLLADLVATHDGRWHSENYPDFDPEALNSFSPTTWLLHMADMASAARILNFGDE